MSIDWLYGAYYQYERLACVEAGARPLQPVLFVGGEAERDCASLGDQHHLFELDTVGTAGLACVALDAQGHADLKHAVVAAAVRAGQGLDHQGRFPSGWGSGVARHLASGRFLAPLLSACFGKISGQVDLVSCFEHVI